MKDIKEMQYNELLDAYVTALENKDGYMKLQLERAIAKKQEDIGMKSKPEPWYRNVHKLNN